MRFQSTRIARESGFIFYCSKHDQRIRNFCGPIPAVVRDFFSTNKIRLLGTGLLQTHATNSAEVVRPAVASAARTSRKAIAGARERVAQLSVLKRGAWWLGNVLRHQRKEKNDSFQKGAS